MRSDQTTTLEYDDPICRVEWGVIITESGEFVRMPDEKSARLAAAAGRTRHLNFQVICREVIYHPWRIMPHDHRPEDEADARSAAEQT